MIVQNFIPNKKRIIFEDNIPVDYYNKMFEMPLKLKGASLILPVCCADTKISVLMLVAEVSCDLVLLLQLHRTRQAFKAIKINSVVSTHTVTFFKTVGEESIRDSSPTYVLLVVSRGTNIATSYKCFRHDFFGELLRTLCAFGHTRFNNHFLSSFWAVVELVRHYSCLPC